MMTMSMIPILSLLKTAQINCICFGIYTCLFLFFNLVLRSSFVFIQVWSFFSSNDGSWILLFLVNRFDFPQAKIMNTFFIFEIHLSYYTIKPRKLYLKGSYQKDFLFQNHPT